MPSAPDSAAQSATKPSTAQTGTAQTAPAQPSATSAVPAQPESPSSAGTATGVTKTGPTATGPVPTSSVAAPVTPQPDTTQPPVTTTPPAPSAPPANAPAFDSSGAITPAASTPAPRSGGAVATSENRTPLKRDYRISLGTFGSEAEANASTAAVRALGYTVYPIDLGSQVVAQVGPFADAATANAALSDIARAYGGAALYAPRQSANAGSQPSPSPSPDKPAATSTASSGASSASSSASPAPASAATPTPATSTATPKQPAQAAAPSGPVYLQVGAFDRQDSAQRLVGMLSDLGYSPSVQAPDGKKVTVLIGPFSGDAVLRAESKLNDNGFDHFRVR
ncbi:SPOR domain-containing protein [Deinococcus rubellus]|uniref:SPOR domain-containing protein n=1 Tax=Deinococcus rubellus TaxID=1889240 RepID=A0ABY5YIR8_9DEIO|nr:SPOR domain-containing protein [Deinococcus rubellus]UWX64002.1 SPOR domain-containing protein [Deinococcus rubellus]